MRILHYEKISQRDRELLQVAKKAAERSVSEKKHKVGCVLTCENGTTFSGATAARTRAIGSTCAERMALDQWYFHHSHPLPRICYLVGTLKRDSWRDDFVVTPCGVCLEMFLEVYVSQKMRMFKFVCSNWKLTRVLVADLSELFPQAGKGGWPYAHVSKRDNA